MNVLQSTVIVSLLLVAGTTIVPAHADEPIEHYTIKVEGGPDEKGLTRLKMFYERLLAELRVSDLGFANIGCDKCSTMTGDQPEGTGTLTFRTYREGLSLPAFMFSYHYVQINESHGLFKMTIDGSTETAGLCPIPLPTGCRKRTICIDTNECDKPYGGACQVCPEP